MAGIQGQQGTKAREVAERYGEAFLEEMDGRFKTARSLRHRFRALTNDLGGVPQLSYQEQSLCRRIVHLERLVERKEATLAHGRTLDENVYYSAVNALSGLLTKIGMKRRPKVVGSTLAELLAAPKEPHAE